jgi:hypothetical protein
VGESFGHKTNSNDRSRLALLGIRKKNARPAGRAIAQSKKGTFPPYGRHVLFEQSKTGFNPTTNGTTLGRGRTCPLRSCQ